MIGGGIGQRIKEERQRLGLTQTAFSSLAGATKGAQQKWECGRAYPNAAALAAFAEAGANLSYIVTGRRIGCEERSWKGMRDVTDAIRAILALIAPADRPALLLKLIAEARVQP